MKIYQVFISCCLLACSCKDDCPGILVKTHNSATGAHYTAIDSIVVKQDAQRKEEIYMTSRRLYDNTVTLLFTSKSDYLNFQGTNTEGLPLVIHTGNHSYQYPPGVYVAKKNMQFEESISYVLPLDTMSTILKSRFEHGGQFVIGENQLLISDDVACGIKKLIK